MLDILRDLDPRITILMAALVTVIVVSILAYAVVAARFGPRARFKRRLAIVSGSQVPSAGSDRSSRETHRRRDVQERLKQFEEGQREKPRRRYQLRRDIEQAGVDITVRQYAIGSALLGIGTLILAVLLGLNVLASILLGIALGLGMPKFILSFLRKRRVKKFISLFPDAIDVIVRGVQSGLPVGECLAIIGRETPEPVSGIFHGIVENLRVGLALDESLERAQENLTSQELKFFAIVMQIQSQTGGNLAETLTNLSTVLRDRKKMRDKIAAMAAEANASAAIIGSLPFLITLALALVNPSYIGILFTSDTGNILIGIGLAWMTIGVVVMRQMINFDI